MARKIKLKVSTRLLRKKAKRSSFGAKKHCKFCASDKNLIALDYKNFPVLKNYLTERGKILPSRISGLCSSHQRAVTSEIKLARVMALLPYTAAQ